MAKGMLYEAVQAVSEALRGIGIEPVLDPRNARPNAVLVELPTADLFTYNVADVRIQLRLLGTPPGNQDSAEYLMTLADKVIDSDLAVIDARPGVATYGNQELPSYDLTVKISVKRN